MFFHRKKYLTFTLLTAFILVFPLILSFFRFPSYYFTYNSNFRIINYETESVHNKYFPDGNSSVLIAIDSNLIGSDKYFIDFSDVVQVFEKWFEPFELRFHLDFHVKNVTTFIPAFNDSLDDSIVKVPNQLSWNLSSGITDPNVNGNGYDWLIIYQELYGLGRNRVNAVKGNALIIAHNQPFDWTSKQLILLHEIGHIFGAIHLEDGYIPSSWYGDAEYSIMNYTDLSTLHNQGWDRENLPIDEHNFELINDSKYRFDQNDADEDTLPNYFEFRHGLDPNNNDSLLDLDKDGLNNFLEYKHGTDPKNTDSDTDGYSDWAEVYVGSSPLNSSEIPLILNPIIIPWTENITINLNEPFTLEWRAISSNPNFYEIYRNDTIQVHEDWIPELIEFPITGTPAGSWNFTCLVVDLDGDLEKSSIFVQIIKSQKTPIYFFELFFPLFLIALFHQKFRSFGLSSSRKDFN
ncbi:MAG: hypothetical protein ACFFAU_19825 [Candidatus Hodarchaeota archaeon]